jgi:hypothetical protein
MITTGMDAMAGSWTCVAQNSQPSMTGVPRSSRITQKMAERLLTVRRSHGVVPFALEKGRHCFARVNVVLDDQDVSGPFAHRAPPFHSGYPGSTCGTPTAAIFATAAMSALASTGLVRCSW